MLLSMLDSRLKRVDIYFQMAPLDVKRKMLGSIFSGKLIFQDGKYRTEGMNPALMLILQKTRELQNEKTGNIVISENVSGDVPKIGLEPTHLTAPEPKSGVSTNFTTWAYGQYESVNDTFLNGFLSRDSSLE